MQQPTKEGSTMWQRTCIRIAALLVPAVLIVSGSGVFAAAGHRVLQPPHRTGELGRYESVVLDPEGNRLKLMV
jgi:hypothetical protein